MVLRGAHGIVAGFLRRFLTRRFCSANFFGREMDLRFREGTEVACVEKIRASSFNDILRGVFSRHLLSIPALH